MAIIIPSKYIYDIDDNKVIDNEVDNLEVGADNPSITTETQSVYTESVAVENSYFGDGSYQGVFAYRHGEIHDDGSFTSLDVTGVSAGYTNAMFLSKEILIPKCKGNALIKKLLVGKKGSGERNINITYTGLVEQGVIEDILGLGGNEWKFIYDKTNDTFTVEQIRFVTVQYRPTNRATQQYTIPVENSQSAYLDERNITATVEVPDGNIATVVAQETTINGIEYYKLNLQILTTVRMEKYVTDGYTNKFKGEDNERVIMSFGIVKGEYTFYHPENLEIEISGVTVSLDLQNETVKIGNGEHIYSFQGNELMQTTNTDSVNDTYQKVIDSWKEGKEVATLRCAIADYKDDNGNVVISNSYQEANIYFTRIDSSPQIGRIYCDKKLHNGDRITFANFTTILEILNVDTNSDYYDIRYYNLDKNIETGVTYQVYVNKGLTDNLYFKFGDIVEPYVYGVHGKDKPMATYKDGTPKQFKVTGVHIIADGGIYQDIDIQEIRQ